MTVSTGLGGGGAVATQQRVTADRDKIGRNDLCWCGCGQEVQEVPRRVVVVHVQPAEPRSSASPARSAKTCPREPGPSAWHWATTAWDLAHLRSPTAEASPYSRCPDGTWLSARHWDMSRGRLCTIAVMADAASLDERLEQIGAQLDWVRDYL